MKKERPASVTVIAVLDIIGSILRIIGAVAILGLLALMNSPDVMANLDANTLAQVEALRPQSGLLNIISIVLLIISIANIVCAVGLFRMASWGLWGTIILSAVGIALSIPTNNLVSTTNLLNVIVIGYLFTQREKFA